MNSKLKGEVDVAHLQLASFHPPQGQIVSLQSFGIFFAGQAQIYFNSLGEPGAKQTSIVLSISTKLRKLWLKIN